MEAGGIPAAWAAPSAAGRASGLSMPMVPHKVPVMTANELSTTNTSSGKHASGIPTASNPAGCRVVPSASNIPPSGPASNRLPARITLRHRFTGSPFGADPPRRKIR